VSRLEVHAGQKSHVWAGVVGGFLIGAGVGALVNSNNEGCLEILDESGCTWIGAGVGGLALGLVGAVVGSVIKTDRWEEVPLGQLRVSVVPQRDGLALGVTVSF
jgi:hypothetical protein